MSNPYANLKTVVEVAHNLKRVSDLADGLSRDWANGLTRIPGAGGDEVDRALRMVDDRSMMRVPARRLYADYRANPAAFRHLAILPGDNESLHGVIAGRYALFDLIPAILERTGKSIAELYIATLGFSKKNGADLCGLIDGGHVQRVAMVCSHYFAETSSEVYRAVIPELKRRGQRIVAMRSHAKMLVMRMVDDVYYVCESSANLRSCVNVEQFVLSRSQELYEFHQSWLEDEILTAIKKGKNL